MQTSCCHANADLFHVATQMQMSATTLLCNCYQELIICLKGKFALKKLIFMQHINSDLENLRPELILMVNQN